MLNRTKKTEGKRAVKKVKTTETEAKSKLEQEEKESNKATPAITKVGTLLKNMRLEKGLKVMDVAKRLCIRKQYLEAIEDSNYSEVPAFPYGVGFVRSYAEFLGLNSGNIVELYKEETNIKKEAKIVVSEPQNKSAMPEIVYVLIGLAAIVLLYGVWTKLNENNRSTENIVSTEELVENNNNEINDVVVVEELTLAQETDNMTDNNVSVNEDNQISVTETSYPETATENKIIETSASANESAAPLEEAKAETQKTIPDKGVFIEILEETWIEVKNEEKLYLSKVLNAGESYTLPNDKGLMLSIGKKGSVNVYVNGTKTDIAHSGKQMHIDIDSYINGNH